MGIISFFHKIRIGFTRMGEASVPYVNSAKRYGDRGEEEFIANLQNYLPECKIKQNVIIMTNEGNAEIDCLVLYKNKLFAIEVKSWKGTIYETDDGFVQNKIDRWTDEIHTKSYKSPFKQLGRAVYLLRKENNVKAWVNAVVFFEKADQVSSKEGSACFLNLSDLVSYMEYEGEKSNAKNAVAFFQNCREADFLRGKNYNTLRSVICDSSLCFQKGNVCLRRNDILSIGVEHHWSYDILTIQTRDGKIFDIKEENAHIKVIDNGNIYKLAFCKLDYIEIGKR